MTLGLRLDPRAVAARQQDALWIGDVFKDADVVSIDELLASREAALVRDDDDGKEEDTSR